MTMKKITKAIIDTTSKIGDEIVNTNMNNIFLYQTSSLK